VKMKIFNGRGDDTVLEGEVNEWLEKNPYVTIKNIRQSSVSNGERLFTLMSVWYDNCRPDRIGDTLFHEHYSSVTYLQHDLAAR
jgi:hypothetical protein